MTRRYLLPANKVCEGYVFTGVCLSTMGGHVWLLRGGMHGCSRGCVCGCSQGVCMDAPGGACMVFLEGVCGFFGGCMVFARGHAWFLLGGVHGFCWGMHGFFRGACMVFSGEYVVFSGGAWVVFFRGAWVVFSGGACIGYDEIWSMSGRYTSYWNAFLFKNFVTFGYILKKYFWAYIQEIKVLFFFILDIF